MRDRGGRIILRAAAVAITAGAIVAYADPAPPIERAASADGAGVVRAARRIVALADRTAVPLSLRVAQAHAATRR